MKNKDWKQVLLTIWDVLFLLVLCFAILFTTMLVSRGAGQAVFTGYVINPVLLACTVFSIAAYLAFMLYASLKQLRQMVDNYFGERNPGEATEDRL